MGRNLSWTLVLLGVAAAVPARAAESCIATQGRQAAEALANTCIEDGGYPPLCAAKRPCADIAAVDREAQRKYGGGFVPALTPEREARIAARSKTENRCGWYINPTPANVWLNDPDGSWVIGIQGGYQAHGQDATPAFPGKAWAATDGAHGSYGYGCACLKVVADDKTRLILRILSGTAKPLSTCKTDKSLKTVPRG